MYTKPNLVVLTGIWFLVWNSKGHQTLRSLEILSSVFLLIFPEQKLDLQKTFQTFVQSVLEAKAHYNKIIFMRDPRSTEGVKEYKSEG